MTRMLSVRVSDEEAEALQREAERSQTTGSELLRASLRAVLARAAATRDAEAYEADPQRPGEVLNAADQMWLPDEDWSAWEQGDATR